MPTVAAVSVLPDQFAEENGMRVSERKTGA